MRTTSLDLRERILVSHDYDEGTRAEIAHRFRVSLGLVKKLLQHSAGILATSPRVTACPGASR
jgi:transposase